MEFDAWAIPNIKALVAKAKAAVKKAHPELDIETETHTRFMWSNDWDEFNTTSVADNTYTQDFSAATTNTFRIKKVDGPYAVVLVGVLLGNLGNLLNSIQIKVGPKISREYPGTLVTSQLNGILLFMDGVFILEKKRVEFIYYNAAGAPASCTSFPYGIAIIPAGA